MKLACVAEVELGRILNEFEAEHVKSWNVIKMDLKITR